MWDAACMGARVGSVPAMANGILAPECHKTIVRLSLIRALNIVLVMTARSLQGNVLLIVMGL